MRVSEREREGEEGASKADGREKGVTIAATRQLCGGDWGGGLATVAMAH